MIPTEPNDDVRRLTSFLEGVERDQIVTYAQLSKVIGVRDIREFRHKIYPAMRNALVSQGATFSSVRGVGYRRHGANGDDLVTMSKRNRKHVGRVCRKTEKTVVVAMRFTSSIDSKNITQLAREQTARGFLMQLSSNRLVKTMPTGIKINHPKISALLIEHLGLPKTTRPNI